MIIDIFYIFIKMDKKFSKKWQKAEDSDQSC